MGLKNGFKKYSVQRKARENIEAEEIFLDAEAVQSLEAKGKLEKPIKGRNFVIAYLIAVFFLLMLFLRTGYLQIVRGDYYRNLADGNKLRIYQLAAPRGIIYDRFGRALVRNVPSFNLVANIADFLDNPSETQEEVLRSISSILLRKPELCEKVEICLSVETELGQEEAMALYIKKEINQSWQKTNKTTLFEDVDRELALVLETVLDSYSGLRVEKNIKREYLLAPYFSHVLGYTGEISSLELEERSDYLLGDRIGKNGLEYQYENVLKGKPGKERLEGVSLGKTSRLLAVKPAQPGQSLVLSLDAELQRKLYQSLKEMTESLSETNKAAALAVDPANGGILALVSLPSFDNNLFSQRLNKDKLQILLEEPDQPFLNRALAGQYAPGSIVKPIMAVAALEENIIGAQETIYCQGGIGVGAWYFGDWKNHGPVNLNKAIAESCNVYFYTIGGGYGDRKGLGGERIAKYFKEFGLGRISQIDLPHEKSGLVPTKDWREAQGNSWYLGDIYNLSIGQGDLLVTPLQMAMAVAGLANGGNLYQPQVVDKVIDFDKNIIRNIFPKITNQSLAKLENLEIAGQGMREAVLSGSARRLLGLPVTSAAKTGTAQFGAEEKTHAWVVSFAPYESPEIVLVVLVEGGGEGYKAAVPVAKDVLEWYFNQKTTNSE